MGFERILSELKRRNVVRVAAVYTVRLLDFAHRHASTLHVESGQKPTLSIGKAGITQKAIFHQNTDAGRAAGRIGSAIPVAFRLRLLLRGLLPCPP